MKKGLYKPAIWLTAAVLLLSIAEMLEIEVVDLPTDPNFVKEKLNEWLEENPDGEDDADFYKGIDG